MTPRPPDDLEAERLSRYFAGECSPAEAAAVRAWIAADENLRHRADLLQQAWEAAGGIPPRGDVDAGWAALSSRMDAPTQTPASSERAPHVLQLHPPRVRQTSWAVDARVAGVILVVGIGGMAAWAMGKRSTSAPAPVARVAEMREVTTKPGQQANVYLSDGTHVVLGVASTLRFPTAFDSTREVTLDGEAFFEVEHDTTRAFSVHMRHGTAKDLGTKFAIRAYHDIASATVVVTEGAVLLTPNEDRVSATTRGTADDSLVLGTTDVARVSVDGRLSVARGALTSSHLAWMAGRLVFDRMPVDEAIAQINRWYGVDVRLGDPTLGAFTLTASLTNEPFDRAITIIAAALEARVARRDSTYTLFSTRGGN
jgi:ferric-dicitrate binding protein FerR (iron transport regulator)